MNEWNLGPIEPVTADLGLIVSLDEARRHMRYASADTSQNPQIIEDLRAAQVYCQQGVPGVLQMLSATYDLPMRNWWGLRNGLSVSPNPERYLQVIPKYPLQAVEAVYYYDTAGVQQTLDSSLYQVRTPFLARGSIEWLPYHAWPVPQALREYPITVRFVAGHGPSTRSTSAISAGTQTVTPASMYGIYAGTRLRVGSPADAGLPELVQVTSITSTTFTATFAVAHSTTPVPIVGAVPPGIRKAILLLVSHWNKNREAVFVVEGRGGVLEIPYSVESLLGSEDWGFYS